MRLRFLGFAHTPTYQTKGIDPWHGDEVRDVEGALADRLLRDFSAFFVGARRGAVVEVQRDATRGLNHYIVTARKTFDTPDPVASKKNVHFSYNHSIS